MDLLDQAERLGDVPFEVRAELASVGLSLRELLGLQPGDLLFRSIPSTDRVRILASGVPLGKGQIVGREGKLAVKVLEVEGGR